MHDSESPRPSSDASPSSPSVAEAIVPGTTLAQSSTLAQRSARAAVHATSASPVDRITIRQRQRNGRRGVVLVFVVVLLTLLGIMGTAYLASSRLDRQAIIGRGDLTGSKTALLRNAQTLDTLQSGVALEAQQQLIRDLFNVAPNIAMDDGVFSVSAQNRFRSTLTTPTMLSSWYENYDAPGRADAWLSSLLPTRLSATNASPVWPWISGPLLTPDAVTVPVTVPPTRITLPGTSAQVDPFFSDPRLMTASGPNSSAAGRYAVTNTAEVYPGQFAATDDTSVSDRHTTQIGFVTMPRTGVADTVRMYPAMAPGPTAAAYPNIFIAGDADGDGIADSGLQPIRINPGATAGIAQYLDTTNNVVYYAAYRIVDNSAKINLNTALDVRGDVAELAVTAGTTEGADSNASTTNTHESGPYGATGAVTATTPELRDYLTEDPNRANTSPATGNTTPVSGVVAPNFGFFRANVGLTGLLRQLMTPLNQANDPNDYARVPSQQDLRRLIDARFPLLKQSPGPVVGNQASAGYYQQAMTDNKDIQSLATTPAILPALAQLKLGTTDQPTMAAAVPVGPYPLQYHYRSFGDLLEQQVARRYGSPGGYLWTNSATTPTIPTNSLVSLGFGDTASLSTKGGSLVNDLISPGTAEQALMFSLRMPTPNVNNNGDAPWGWFPPNAMNLWFGWTQDFDVVPGVTPPSIIALDATLPQDRAFDYSFGSNANQIGLSTDPNAMGSKPNGTANVVLPRSPRVLFTTYNGITSTVPTRGDQAVATSPPTAVPTPGLPIGMPAYTPGTARDRPGGAGTGGGHNSIIVNSVVGADPYNATTYFNYPNVKVSAATGTKEQLWRAFWSSMTQQVPFNYGAFGKVYQTSFWDAARKTSPTVPSAWTTYDPSQFYEAFRAPDRYGSDEGSFTAPTNLGYLPGGPYNEANRPDQVMSTRQMALIRSAVAACNTIDLRDNDNDITAMDVDVTDDNTIPAGGRYYARVYGTEKQLVISGVYVMNSATPQVAVEIYNPTDLPIQLSAYHLAQMTRTGVAPTFKTAGVVNVVPGTTPIRLSTAATDFLAPGGYVVIYNSATPDLAGKFAGPPVTLVAPPVTNPPTPLTSYVLTPNNRNGTTSQVVTGATELTQLTNGNTELVLVRTRRADGVPFVDGTAVGVRAGIENETANNATGVEDTVVPGNTTIESLVTLDAVDCRYGAVGTGLRFLYQRQRPAPPPLVATNPSTNPLAAGPDTAERTSAWRCFFAGNFYNLRTPGPRAAAVTAPTSGVVTNAWELLTNTTPVNFGSAITGALGPPPFPTTGGTATVLAPAIPIQNFRPYDPYTESNQRPVSTALPLLSGPNTTYGVAAYNAAITGDPTLRGLIHLITEFPYGSPFAREMDLQAIPYIGSYKIYRDTGGAAVLYEYVPLTMDAVNVTHDLVTATTVPETLTVGRFDPRPDTGNEPNAWTASLTDFVTARHAPQTTYFPDVPTVSVQTTFYNTQTVAGVVPTATQDQRYAQDGPITGTGANNMFGDVSYVSFVERSGTADAAMPLTVRQGLRSGIDAQTGAVSSLTQGVLNVNTAPQIALRQLPWVVDSATGQVDFVPNPTAGGDFQLRTTVNSIVADPALGRDAKAAANWTGPTAAPYQTFGFASLASLSDPTTGIPTIAKNGVDQTGAIKDPTSITSPPTAIELLRMGMLNPMNRNEILSNYQLQQLNLARVSNLLTTRSDVYTVYVTVQAWTWAGGVGGNQVTDTRLVGERRTSFVVDRSKIDSDHFGLDSLIVLPIERE